MRWLRQWCHISHRLRRFIFVRHKIISHFWSVHSSHNSSCSARADNPNPYIIPCLLNDSLFLMITCHILNSYLSLARLKLNHCMKMKRNRIWKDWARLEQFYNCVHTNTHIWYVYPCYDISVLALTSFCSNLVQNAESALSASDRIHSLDHITCTAVSAAVFNAPHNWDSTSLR